IRRGIADLRYFNRPAGPGVRTWTPRVRMHAGLFAQGEEEPRDLPVSASRVARQARRGSRPGRQQGNATSPIAEPARREVLGAIPEHWPGRALLSESLTNGT